MGSHDKKTDKYSYVLPGSLFLLSGSVKFCGESPTGSVKKITKNQSPKGNMWSAIPFALLCMIVNLSERKQGSGPEGDEVL